MLQIICNCFAKRAVSNQGALGGGQVRGWMDQVLRGWVLLLQGWVLPRIGSSPGNLRKMRTVWSVTCWWWWWWMLVYASSLFYLYFPEDGWSGIGIKTQLVWVDLSFSCVLIHRGIIGIHCVSRGERRAGFLDMTNNSCVYIIHSWYAWRKPKLFFHKYIT